MDKAFIHTSIEDIRAAIKDGKLIIFVGAGVSMNSGLPSWKKLLEPMIQEMGLSNEEHDYLKIAQMYYNERGKVQYFEKIDQQLNTQLKEPNSIHNAIFRLEPVHIVTTNYDTLLEEAAKKNDKFYAPVICNEDLPEKRNKKELIIKQ